MKAVEVPPTKPRLHPSEVEAYLAEFLTQENKFLFPIVILGIRGYYKTSMGDVAKNDRGIYDDAIFIKTPDGIYPYNGNTDPSGTRIGTGTGAQKGMATLKTRHLLCASCRLAQWQVHRIGAACCKCYRYTRWRATV
jgi:hypothetical protein